MNEKTPYTPPQSNVTGGSQQQFAELKMLSSGPRIGRLRYFSYSVGLYILSSFSIIILTTVMTTTMTLDPGMTTGMPAATMLILAILYLFIFVIGFIFTIKRLHDLDQTGWLSLLMLIPLVGFFFVLYLLFARGSMEANRYGNPPPPNSGGVIATAWIFPAIMIIGILAAIAIPAYNGYIQATQEAQMPH